MLKVSKSTNPYKNIKDMVEQIQKAEQGWVPITEDVYQTPSGRASVHGEFQSPLISIEYGAEVLSLYPNKLAILNGKELCYIITGEL
jgi:hypothetical protein